MWMVTTEGGKREDTTPHVPIPPALPNLLATFFGRTLLKARGRLSCVNETLLSVLHQKGLHFSGWPMLIEDVLDLWIVSLTRDHTGVFISIPESQSLFPSPFTVCLQHPIKKLSS